MSARIFISFCFLFPLLLTAQNLTDDFSDGDLLNPDWFGNVDSFSVENEQLRLTANVGGTSTISLFAQTSTEETIVYEFLVNLDFSPSGSNFATVRLDGTNVGGDAAGYMLQIGGISGNDDALEFTAFGGDIVGIPVISGTPGAVGTNPVAVRVRLTRTADNVWTMEADYTGGTDFALEGTNTDAQGTPPFRLNFFTFECFYTTTRSDLFYFDDINIGPIIEDLDAPEITSSNLAGDDRIVLLFNEPVEEATAGNLNNYSLNITSPMLDEVQFNPAGVELQFDGPLPVGENIEVTVNELTDLSENTGGPYLETFFIEPTIPPGPGDLIITEFMADPSPQVGLPNAEYVEVYNRSDVLMRVNDLQISSGGASQTVSDFDLEPGEYRVIIDVDDANEFSGLAPFAFVSSFPSLSNGGDVIELTHNGQLIQRLEYTDDWYNDPEREDGGYSLELTDVNTNNFECQGLWAASQSPQGGTPSSANSVAGLVVDSQGPTLLRGGFVTGGVELLFSENLGDNPDLGAFSITPDLGVTGLTRTASGTYRLELANDPANSQLYTVTVTNEISDCAGNFSAANSSIQLGIAEEVVVGDVVINEILFNPFTGGVDYVELFNCSEKILNVEGWTLENNLAQTGSLRERINANVLFLPGTYLVFSPDVDDVIALYPSQAQPQFLIENRLPSLPDDSGNISVLAPDGEELDSFDYAEEFHSALLDDEDGVSLERINPKATTMNAGNWFSAAARVGFGTPTRENSQRRDAVANPGGDNFFSLDEDTFSPDEDGFQDALLINYETPAAGWNARIRIFDANGRLVRELLRIDLLAGAGTIIWDGSNDDRERVRTGIYVLLIERFEPDGSTATEKLVAVAVNPKG